MDWSARERILELVEEGVLDKDLVILACLKWLTDGAIEKMAEANEFFTEDEDEIPEIDEPIHFKHVR